MGNRTDEKEYTPIINPADNPFLHIHTLDQGETYRYIANFEALALQVGNCWYSPQQEFQFENKDGLTIDFLPPITRVPPPEYHTETLVRKVIATHAQAILGLINADLNAFVCWHGVNWGFLPEEEIARVLQTAGYTVTNPLNTENGQHIFPRVGGRKRIQKHILFFEQPK